VFYLFATYRGGVTNGSDASVAAIVARQQREQMAAVAGVGMLGAKMAGANAGLASFAAAIARQQREQMAAVAGVGMLGAKMAGASAGLASFAAAIALQQEQMAAFAGVTRVSDAMVGSLSAMGSVAAAMARPHTELTTRVGDVATWSDVARRYHVDVASLEPTTAVSAGSDVVPMSDSTAGLDAIQVATAIVGAYILACAIVLALTYPDDVELFASRIEVAGFFVMVIRTLLRWTDGDGPGESSR
jgi:hypothetical protein